MDLGNMYESLKSANCYKKSKTNIDIENLICSPFSAQFCHFFDPVLPTSGISALKTKCLVVGHHPINWSGRVKPEKDCWWKYFSDWLDATESTLGSSSLVTGRTCKYQNRTNKGFARQNRPSNGGNRRVPGERGGGRAREGPPDSSQASGR